MNVARRRRWLRSSVLVATIAAIAMPAVAPGIVAAAPNPAPVISGSLATVVEGDGPDVTMHFVLQLDRVSSTPVTVQVATRDGGATSPADFDALAPTTVTFAPGATSRIVDVTVHGDTIDEGDYEYLLLDLSDPVGADFGGGSSVSIEGRIYDDEPTVSPAPVLSGSLATVVEGDGPDVTMHFVLQLDRVSSTPVTVQVATRDGGATSPADFDALAPTTVTFAPGATSRIVDVTVHGDTIDEGDYEYLLLDLSDPVGADFGGGSSVSIEGRIYDDEPTVPPAPVLSGSLATVVEGDGPDVTMHFVLQLDRVSSTPVTVQVATRDGGATSPADFDALAPTTVTFAPGATSRIVDVTVHGDTIDEGDYEYLLLDLSDPVGADFGGGSSVSIEGRIYDDEGDGDPVPSRQIHIASPSVIEGDDGDTRTLHFTVSLDRPASTPVTVDATSHDNDATDADGDYDALPPTTLTFAPGQQVIDVPITVHGDTRDEFESETMYVQLSQPERRRAGVLRDVRVRHHLRR